MIGIHPVHRRLAELQIKAERLGGYLLRRGGDGAMIETIYSRPALEEYGAALAEYKVAHIYFDQAPPERAEEAVYRLAAAEKRLDEALRQLKAEREQAKRPG